MARGQGLWDAGSLLTESEPLRAGHTPELRMGLPHRGSSYDDLKRKGSAVGVSPKKSLAHVNLGSSLTSPCLREKWAQAGTHLLRLLVIMT